MVDFRLRISTLSKLEQLERLRSEDPLRPHDYPYFWFILDLPHFNFVERGV